MSTPTIAAHEVRRQASQTVALDEHGALLAVRALGTGEWRDSHTGRPVTVVIPDLAATAQP